MDVRRFVLSFALVALAPSVGEAQFTTFVAPPKKVDTVVAGDSVVVAAAPTADSVARATIANMKAWVDSAGGDAVDLRAATSRSTTTPTVGEPVATFSDGAPAPNTATMLPLIAAFGASAVGVGVVLLRRK